MLAGPRVEQINAQQGQVERARGALKMAEANALEMKRREQELTTRRAEIERSKASLALIDSQLADTIAVSPVDGVVLVKSADVGEVLAPGTTVVTVGDIDHPWLRGYINETDLGKVKLGLEGAGDHRFVSRQSLQRARDVHRLGGGVHAQADSDRSRSA